MKLIGAAEAAALVKSGSTVVVSGSGGGHAVPEAVLAALEARFLAGGQPRDLCLVHVVGIGDRVSSSGADRFAHEGMVKRSVTSALVDAPRLMALARANKIESYTLPQGVLSQLMREIAGGRPGLITRTGLHSFIDPRQGGGRQSASATEDLVEVVTLGGAEYLRYKPLAFDVAILRGTTADEDGNVSMEQEAIPGEMISTAQAARRNGGIVIVQVKRLARRGSLPPHRVKIPGVLVDVVVVDPAQKQTYETTYDPAYSGELRVPLAALAPLPLDARKVIARRGAMELFPGAVCNLGAGVSTGISAIAAEEGMLDDIVLTNEQGFIGGAPLTGRDSGGAVNYAAVVDQPYQFDFYDGGGLDLAFLSFAAVDAQGNVTVSRFDDRIVGVGGFINISQNARMVVFGGTLTAGGLAVECGDGTLRIAREGRHRKFVNSFEQICYNAAFARQEGRRAIFVTERAVFDTPPIGSGDGALRLIEIAPGIDLQRDVLDRMDFRPLIADDLRRMDARIFAAGPMNLRSFARAAAAQ